MRVSFTDQWPTFLDENGKPLIGRIKFMKADASQFKNVYYENDFGQEVLAPNPCYTLQDGRLEHQIFLDYGVYTCIVEKFIGSDWQNMLDYADDPTYWDEYKRFKAYGGEDDSEETSDLGSGFCDTIAALRNINPTEHSVVDVVGYYSKDDKIAPRTYVWVAGNGDAEDFGSTILSSLSDFAAAGRWKLCETPVLCSTTFGVFPDRGNTITAAELSQKASALYQFANSSSCTEVFFPAGHYYFATGTTISIKPKVTSNGTDTKPLKFDADGIQRDEEVVGTISVSFLGGLEVPQDSEICDNGAHTSFTFGFGTIKTSWVKYGTSKHIQNSSIFKNIHCILNYSSSTDFCNEGDSFSNWTFEGSAQSNQTIPNNTSFTDCTFIGKCFRCGNGIAFTRCGEIRTSQLNNLVKDNSVWNTDGSVKSVGTTFLVDGTFEIVQDYGENTIDNSPVKVVSKDGILFNRTATLKVLEKVDNGLKFRGKIVFKENKVGKDLVFDMYYSIDDCYASMESVYDDDSVICLIDLCGNVISSYPVVGQTLLPFKNGGIALACSGMTSSPTIHAEKASISFVDVQEGSYFILNAKDCEVSCNNNYLRLEDADCEGVLFNDHVILQNVTDSDLKHRFIGCTFKSRIELDATDYLTNVHCDIVVTGCTFDSTYNPAIIVTNQSNFIDDRYNHYIIKDNQFFGGSGLKPAHEFEGIFNTTTDGTTQSGCYTGSLTTAWLAWKNLITDLYSADLMFHVGYRSAIFEYDVLSSVDVSDYVNGIFEDLTINGSPIRLILMQPSVYPIVSILVKGRKI